MGVVIGEDLVVRNGCIVTDAAKRSSQDRSVHGYRTMLGNDPKTARKLADRIIKNTYRTLMTRGQKGCYVFCVDEETNEYFKKFVISDFGRRVAGFPWPKVAEPDLPGNGPSGLR